MLKRRTPGIDWEIASQQGTTRDGQPMSYSRAPAPELAPWISGLYVTVIDAPEQHRLDCGLFNDCAVLRMQLRGHWTAETAEGLLEHERAALLFGPQTRRMAVTVTGPFTSAGIQLRPGVWHALLRKNSAELLDRIVPVDIMGLDGDMALLSLDACDGPEQQLKVLEDIVAKAIARAGSRKPDPVTVRFEELAFTDPTANISDFARSIGVEQRRLERIIKRDFGMSPKQVLRRARVLDMASHLRGVADGAEADELELRYYDQSHMIRDFVEYFGVTPGVFVETPQPILTLALETRQARRLEALARLEPGAPKPWEQPRTDLPLTAQTPPLAKRPACASRRPGSARRSIEKRADRAFIGDPADRFADQRRARQDADARRNPWRHRSAGSNR